ncbi:MAG: hypothetical protein FWC70_02095 [Defluviitaleaceae bacterium]|nr:hypothetical protein [Defluviitaleaceae bacterium]
MPMYQNYHFTMNAPLEDAVDAINRIMNTMQWGIEHEFDRFDMSVDYKRNKRRGLFGRQSADDKHIAMDATVRFKEVGDKVNVFLLSSEAVGDAIAASTGAGSPEKRKILTETHHALLDGLRARGML